MTNSELAAAFGQLRMDATTIIGFHLLSEDGKGTPLQQTIYDAHVYAGGVQLALQLVQIVDAILDRKDDW